MRVLTGDTRDYPTATGTFGKPRDGQNIDTYVIIDGSLEDDDLTTVEILIPIEEAHALARRILAVADPVIADPNGEEGIKVRPMTTGEVDDILREEGY